MGFQSSVATGARALLAVALTFGSVGLASADDDKSIKGPQRLAIKQAVGDYVRAAERDGKLLHYDAAAGEMMRLRFLKVHAQIEKKGPFYVSCADFADIEGGVVDVDFLILPDGDSFRVNQTVVHGVGGKKRELYLDD